MRSLLTLMNNLYHLRCLSFLGYVRVIHGKPLQDSDDEMCGSASA